MSRTISNTVDYFPHFAKQGKTIFILKSRFGNDGYAFWFQLLEVLCQSENHVYDCKNEAAWQYLLSITGTRNEITGTEMLGLLAKLGNIDPELWGDRVIWCEALVGNLSDVYKKRGRQLPSKPVPVTSNAIPDTSNPLTGTEMPQRKVNKTKVNKTKSTQEISLPEWIDKTSWDAYLEMRKAKPRTPTTPHAIELVLKKLADLKAIGQDINKVLDQSTLNGWTDVYPVKEGNNGQRPAQHQGVTSIPGNRPAGAFANFENV